MKYCYFFFLLFCGFLFAQGDTSVVAASKYTQEDMMEIYNSKSQKQRDLMDKMAPAVRNEHLESLLDRKRLLMRLKEEKERNSYIVPAKLKEAFTAYGDEKIPREKVIEMFEDFIKQDPETPFLPEIYFRIGALYSIHKRGNLGEKKVWEMQKKYYEKAHKLYGKKFSYLHKTAWASLVNHSTYKLNDRKAYYEWLLRMNKTNDPNDIYPIRDVRACYNGRPPQILETEKQVVIKGLKVNIPKSIKVAEKNILWRTGGNRLELLDLFKSYPNTMLGKVAEERLSTIDDAYRDLANLESDDVTGSDISIDESSNDVDKLIQKTQKTAIAEVKESLTTEQKLTPKNKRNPMIWLISGISVLAAVVIIVSKTTKKTKQE